MNSASGYSSTTRCAAARHPPPPLPLLSPSRIWLSPSHTLSLVLAWECVPRVRVRVRVPVYACPHVPIVRVPIVSLPARLLGHGRPSGALPRRPLL